MDNIFEHGPMEFRAKRMKIFDLPNLSPKIPNHYGLLAVGKQQEIVCIHLSQVSHHSHASEPGSLLTLGIGDFGQLGLGEEIKRKKKPSTVSLNSKIIQVASGGLHTACLTVEGDVFTFGCNDNGALGHSLVDSDGCSYMPQPVLLPGKIVQISAGDSHTAALTDDGRLFAWGTFTDSTGPIGLISCKKELNPIQVPINKYVFSISSGNDHILCLADNGDIFSFGNAEQGQLGRVPRNLMPRGGTYGLDFLCKPRKVHSVWQAYDVKYSDVWAAEYVSFAKQKKNGSIVAWGLNNAFQLGIINQQKVYSPCLVSSLNQHQCQWCEISAGLHHTLLLDMEGRVYSMGCSHYGRLGLGTVAQEVVTSPTLIEKLPECVQVNCSSNVSYAISTSGKLYAWGMGSNYQLGQGDSWDLDVPMEVQGELLHTKKVLMVSSGGQHTAILVSDDTDYSHDS